MAFKHETWPYFPAPIARWPSVPQPFSWPVLFVTSVFCWTTNCLLTRWLRPAFISYVVFARFVVDQDRMPLCSWWWLCHLPARLLQLGAISHSVVHSTPNSAGREYCRTVGVWTAASWSRDVSCHSTTLVAYTLANLLQALYFNARTPHWTLPFLFGRRHINKPEADCDQLTPRTTLHHVWVLSFGERAHSYAGPAVWNFLPADLRGIQETAVFRRSLKTPCFSLAYNIIFLLYFYYLRGE